MLLTQQTSVAFLPVSHRAEAPAQLASFQDLEVKELGLKTIDQEPVLGVYARRFRDLRKLARALQPLRIPLYEADVWAEFLGYLSPIIDCFDGMVVSWTIGTSPDAELANTMLDAAIETVAETTDRPVAHSDRGGHYRWLGYRE